MRMAAVFFPYDVVWMFGIRNTRSVNSYAFTGWPSYGTSPRTCNLTNISLLMKTKNNLYKRNLRVEILEFML